MFNPTKKRVLLASGAAITALFGLVITHGTIQAQEESAGVAVGTYGWEQIAQQAGIQQKLQQQLGAFQGRMQEAQQSGDQQAMQQIQTEAQQIQQKVVADFEASVEKVLPAVAEAAGVQIIAVEVAYTADGVETKDLTADIVSEMGVEAPEAAPAPAPLQQ